jgi:hypothetical protein
MQINDMHAQYMFRFLCVTKVKKYNLNNMYTSYNEYFSLHCKSVFKCMFYSRFVLFNIRVKYILSLKFES